jgi:hypothetical protein
MVVLIVLSLAVVGAAWAQAPTAPQAAAAPAAAAPQDPGITWKVDDKPTTDAAAELSKMVGFDIYVTKPTDTKVTLDEQGVSVEDAIADLADAGGCSWIRAYLIEKQPGKIQYTAEQLLTILGRIRQTWTDSMTDDQMADYNSMVRDVIAEMRADPFAPPAPMPGGGIARGQFGGGAGGGGQVTDDPIRGLLPNLRLDTVTLHLKDATVQQMQIQLLTNSGFTCVVEDELTGKTTETVVNANLWPTLTDIAKAVGGKVKPVFILAKPVVLTDDQVAARDEAQFQSTWQDFWGKAPVDRTQDIKDQAAGLNMMAQRMQQMAQGGGAGAAGGAGGGGFFGGGPGGGRGGAGGGAARITRSMPRRMSRMADYMATLNAGQRSELQPLMKAMGAAYQAAKAAQAAGGR